jgi:hypothetical protein
LYELGSGIGAQKADNLFVAVTLIFDQKSYF